ncbi:MAG: hypothetical protein AVDCRST_MAG43-65 [uncultured Thermomicrobiales bacterium]|uniref:HAD family hydrolase n=1 Tax=uncultured Thermomicrobiales bacterium TaxID=1645740 RepID=A0A6J4U6C4_9BACT|nr:MAG: hypothetical protein AVDCRST_MAG43-65 [uncultured Thermomicrobiales bacterium]
MQSNSIPVCVLSNIDRTDIEAAISLHGFRSHDHVTSDDAKASKPRPEMFRLGLELLGLHANDVLHVGDSRSSDVAGACAMEIPVAWVNRTSRPVDEEPTPAYIVQDLAGVIEIVKPMWPRRGTHPMAG